jgi:hypothetical protein
MPRSRQLQRVHMPATSVADLADASNRMQDQLLAALNPVLAMTLSERVDVPASVTANGSVGHWAADASYLYVCVSASTWRRVAISTW